MFSQTFLQECNEAPKKRRTLLALTLRLDQGPEGPLGDPEGPRFRFASTLGPVRALA